MNKEFTVGNGEEVDFVYDMSVFKAGNSGKYILKPVVGESGTGDQVAIEDVDEREDDSDADGADENDSDDEAELAALNASFVGNVTAGENATVEVTRNGSAVENATVEVTQELAADEMTETHTTDGNGTVTFAVDANATELSVEVTAGDDEAEIEREFESTEGEEANGDGGEGGADDGSDSAALRAAAV